MTLQEIDELELLDVAGYLLGYMLDLELLPPDEPLYTISDDEVAPYFRIIVNPVYEKPTQLELNAQFSAYKQSLTDMENARLEEVARRDDLRSRWQTISDKNAVFAAVFPSLSNRKVWFRDFLNDTNHEAVELKMVEIEAKNVELIALGDAEEIARQERRDEILALKALIADVNASDLPPWHKKILRKLIRDLKE